MAIEGTNASEHIAGTFSSDVIYGYGGNDTIDADIGNDRVYGGSGNDYIDGDYGDNVLYGEAGNDTIIGGGGDSDDYGSIIDGGSGFDSLVGTVNFDTIRGGDGDDTIVAGHGDDSLYGGTGDDTFIIRFNGNDGFKDYDGGAGDYDTIRVEGYMYGSAPIKINSIAGVEYIKNLSSDPGYIEGSGLLDLSGVKVTNVSEIRGSAGHDVLIAPHLVYDSQGNPVGIRMLAGVGNDRLVGSHGDDTLKGSGGHDTLDGRIGNDLITGWSGNNVFVVGSDTGDDVITDFTDGSDLVDFTETSANSIDDITITQIGNDLEIAVDFSTILLQGVDASIFDASDFLF